ncbi:MAG: hypothetical protein OXT09_14050 [Myxococcales bacterium]|nr:hypothetical protein [Myxococcales bacterium]
MAGPEPDQYAGERDEARFWAEAVPSREPALRRGFIPPVLLAVALSVPWYWGDHAPLWLGLPAWVVVTIACSAAISAITAYAALVHWRDDGE